MKVVCIKKYLSTSLKYELTYGKIYETLDTTGYVFAEDFYRIKCDRGFIDHYSKSSFVNIEDWRQQQLDKVLT
jgi:hypothetical protein